MTQVQTVRDDRAINHALRICERRWSVQRDQLSGTGMAGMFFQLRMHRLKREVFDVAFLDNAHYLIAVERVFSGTVTGSPIYPREVARKALKHNACAVIVAHNHPSGSNKPSAQDIEITRVLKAVLALIEVELLDHVIVGTKANSLRERGML